MSVAVIGSIARDTIETPRGTRRDLLGGSATYFAAAARLFVKTHVIGVVGTDFRPEDESALQELGVNTNLLERRPGRTYSWHGRYGADFANAITVSRDVGVFTDYRPRLAEKPAEIEGLFLGAISPSLQNRVLQAWPGVAVCALDSREAWIHEGRSEVLELTRRVDYVLLNEFELAALTGCGDIQHGSRKLICNGARCVVVKRGANGARLFSRDLNLTVPAYRTAVVDPTGAGDAFAGGFLGAVMSGEGRDRTTTLSGALRYGAGAASVALEGFGIGPLATLARSDLDSRAVALQVSEDV